MTTQTLSRRSFLQASVAVGGRADAWFPHAPRRWLRASVRGRRSRRRPAVGHRGQRLDRDRQGQQPSHCASRHTEMGQGGITSVAMLIAEELNVDWSRIKTEFCRREQATCATTKNTR